MFSFNELKTIHVELTSRCQASCPMCARNYHGGQENPNLILSEITFEEFKHIFDETVLTQIDYIYFCGNYGDPIISNHLIDIVEYCNLVNSNIRLEIHTNGSARTLEWWKELARKLPKNHCVHFALDGLEDTHHIYRVGTNFDNIINNATAFIQAGGIATWVYLSFKHNEHQVEKAKQLAYSLGFNKFNHKTTGRFLEKPSYNVLDQKDNIVYNIEPTTDRDLVFIRPEVIKNYKKIFANSAIECKVQKEKSIYVDSQKHIWPCCWTGALPYIYARSTDAVFEYHQDQRATINEIVDKLGGYDSINLLTVSIRLVLNNSIWNTIWKEYWGDNKLSTCARQCGKALTNIISQAPDQTVNVENLK